MTALKTTKPKATKGSGQTVIRPLGQLEQYQSALHLLDFYAGTSVACSYAGPEVSAILETRGAGSDEGVLPTWLARAVAGVVREQPLLRVGLLEEDSRRPKWVELEKIELANHITYVAETVDQESHNAQDEFLLDAKFDQLETRPGWRILATRRRAADKSYYLDVLFSWNHTNMDGMSGKIFHMLLLRHLNACDKEMQESETPPSRPEDSWPHAVSASIDPRLFPQPHEHLFKMKLTPPYLLKMLVEHKAPEWLTPESMKRAYAHWAPMRRGPVKTHYAEFGLAEGPLSTVLQLCRRYDTTLTGLLHALTLTSMALQLPESQQVAFRAQTPITTRRFIKARDKDTGHEWVDPYETLANYVCSSKHHFGRRQVAEIRRLLPRTTSQPPDDVSREAHLSQPPAPTAAPELPTELLKVVWDAAQGVRQDINEYLETGTTDMATGMMKFVGDWRAEHEANVEKPRPSSWMITNIGVLDGSGGVGGGGRWAIDRARFLICAEAVGRALNISAISVKDKGLFVGLSWQDGAVEDSLGRGIAVNLEDLHPTISHGTMTKEKSIGGSIGVGDDHVAAVIRAMAPVDFSAPFDKSGVAGKVILITGGASGLGAAFAREWASRGAFIFVADLDDKRGEELVAELRRSTGSPHHHYQHCDVTDWASQVELFKAAVRASPTGGIDAVVPNAGIGHDSGKPGEPGNFGDPLDLDGEAPPPPKTKVLDVNLTGVLYTVQLAIFWLLKNPAPQKDQGEEHGTHSTGIGETAEDKQKRITKWHKQRDRHILLMGSIGGIMPLTGSPQYTASKHAVTALFRCLRVTCFWRGIRVNMLMPCFVDTPMVPNGVMFLLAGGGKATVEDVVDAGTRFMADKDVCGRAAVVGPRMKVEDLGVEEGQSARIVEIDPGKTNTGRGGVWPGSQAAWECYAHDYENCETFVYRYTRVLAGYTVLRGWVGWWRDVLALMFRKASA
ncbi:hypothetical protein PspLS_06377 [Pyricularia sp. CBS 133598]|nr:hypothetical protein PspLS_06377 [Pyricularia sp. CBS 133598]